MQTVYFFAHKTLPTIFGGLTASHGQLPAFFTSQIDAIKFGEERIPKSERENFHFANSDNPSDIRTFLTQMEKSYVLLDNTPMTAVEMASKLNSE